MQLRIGTSIFKLGPASIEVVLAALIPLTFAAPALGQCDPVQTAKVLASDGAADDLFGHAAAVSEDIAIVGAYQDDDLGDDSGSAYIFQRDAGGLEAWGQVAKLTASDGAAGDWFGHSVGASGDLAIVGARFSDRFGADSGSVYVYERDAGGPDNWGQVAQLTPQDGSAGDEFGRSVAIERDIAVVGAAGWSGTFERVGNAYIFQRSKGGQWVQVKRLDPPGSAFSRWGWSVALDADTAVVSAHGGRGAIRIYQRDEGGPDNWGEVRLITDPTLPPEAHLGIPVAISDDTLIAGATGDDVNGPGSGSAFIFGKDIGGPNNWGVTAKLVPADGAADDAFGIGVALTDEGIAIVGASGDDDNGESSGSAYVFGRNAGGIGRWGEADKLLPSDGEAGDRFGVSTGEGAAAIVGASGDDDNGSEAGSLYLFNVVGCGALIEFDPPSEFISFGISNFEDSGDLDTGGADQGTSDVVIVIPDPDPQQPGAIQILLNQGIDGNESWLGFSAEDPITVGRDPTGVTVGLLDDDMHLDLAVTNGEDDTVTILINQGDGSFIALPPFPVGNRPSSIIAGDFTEDGFVDLAVANQLDDTVGIYAGDGLGNFTQFLDLPTGGMAPLRIEPEDIDNDKCLDIVGVNNLGSASPGGPAVGSVFVLHNAGGGSFDPAVTYDIGTDPRDVSSGDLDGDLFPDLAAVNTGDDTLSVLVNNGDGTFTLQPMTIPTGDEPLAVDVQDLDTDLDADLAVVATDEILGPAIQVFQNLTDTAGDPVFAPPLVFEVEDEPDLDADPLYVISEELNEDQRFDLVTVNIDDGPTSGSVSALLNSGAVNLLPASIGVNGTLLAGEIEMLFESDDDYLVIMHEGGGGDAAALPPLMPDRHQLPMVQLDVVGYTSLAEPSDLSVTVEAAVITAHPIMQRVLFHSHWLKGWEEVDARLATPDDTSIEASPAGPASRFIDPESHRMRVRIEWFDPGSVMNPDLWLTRTDQAVWTITP